MLTNKVKVVTCVACLATACSSPKRGNETEVKAEGPRAASASGLLERLEKNEQELAELRKKQDKMSALQARVTLLELQVNILAKNEITLNIQITSLKEQMKNAASKSDLEKLESELKEATASLAKTAQDLATTRTALSQTVQELGALKSNVADIGSQITDLKNYVSSLEKNLHKKLTANSFAKKNAEIMDRKIGNFKTHELKGKYKVLVVPVEFVDKRFTDTDYIQNANGLHDFVFGNESGSMSNYYKHASGGRLGISGEIAPIVRVDKSLEHYGAPEGTSHDRAAPELVFDALEKLKALKQGDEGWWDQFDNWDLNDYDGDNNYYEKDGYIDSLVFIYAGKDQAVCEALFTAADVSNADAPSHQAALDCVNRIWPHRFSVFTPPVKPDKPPVIEGGKAPILGIKITNRVYAFDYNMQSEFSSRSTWIHEFGHSLTLADFYAQYGGTDNATGSWEVMSQNGRNEAQELSSFNKMLLGWLEPKIIKWSPNLQSAYLGSYNFFTETERNQPEAYHGPRKQEYFEDGLNRTVDIVSQTEQGEPVYRSVLIDLPPKNYEEKILDYPASWGHKAIFAGNANNANTKYNLEVKVPADGKGKLTFETIYELESDVNFMDKSVPNADLKIVTAYDTGVLKINDEVAETWQGRSGDANSDGLVEANPDCNVAKVLELREKWRTTPNLPQNETQEFEKGYEKCTKGVIVTKTLDLSKYKGKTAKVSLEYHTDAGTTWLGIFADNFKLDDSYLERFETISDLESDSTFSILTDGVESSQANQFYMLEYRDPSENFNHASYNMDNNIDEYTRAFFLQNAAGENKNLLERFRVTTYAYQPGVLLWYFNSRFSQYTNSPGAPTNNGESFYQLVNSRIAEMPLPSLLGNKDLFDANGQYNMDGEVFKNLSALINKEFICFAYPDFYKYIKGSPFADCTMSDGNTAPYYNGMRTLTLNGRKLMQASESINDSSPKEQQMQQAIRTAFTGLSGSGMRIGTATFRTQKMGNFSPFTTYKIGPQNTMVPDADTTSQSYTSVPVSNFSDVNYGIDADHRKYERFKYDSAVVNPLGVKIDFVDPDERVLEYYEHSAGTDANSNNYIMRKPRVKIYIHK